MGSFTRTMRLLASVLSITAADYACCPYDEYGVPDSDCSNVLTEKSPFADLITADNGGSIVPEESYACKAWEANAGAAIENHKGSGARDWGSCGFQRHFPWYNAVPTATTDPLAALGLFDAANSYDPNYKVFGTGGTFAGTGTNGWNMLSLTKGSFSNDGAQPITGDVHLGAVCKLFVPVQKEYIRQVSIAGVHINNARIWNGKSYALSAEMNAVVVGGFNPGTVSDAWSGSYHAGTAYCFSVVNIAEFMTNRANLIANANVAGTDARTAADDRWYADDQGLQYKDANGASVAAQFGTIWPGSAATDPTGGGDALKGTAGQKTSGQHKVNLGSNFDVVVHFDSAWCSAHWELIDMQKSDDHGAGTNHQLAGGNLQGYASNGGAHPGAGEAKMDAWDKRLPVGTGSCGLCKDKSSVQRGPSTSAVGSDCVTNSWEAAITGVTATMGQTEGFNYHGGAMATPNGCIDLNSYPQSSNLRRWPNAGAWAAFYSFVTCANSDYMIYGQATRTVRTVTLSTTTADHLVENKPNDAAPAESATEGDKSDSITDGVRNNDNRMVVVGGWHQDYRHGTGACVRFNIRQVGEHIQYCADGDEEEFNTSTDTNTMYKNPTGDTQAWSQNKNMRCTWNWNFNELSNGGYDAEAWFDSIDPLHMQVWETDAVSQELAEKFIDEPAPGAPSAAANGYQAAVLGGTLTSDVVINVMIQERPRATNGVAHTSAFVVPTNLIMDAGYATATTPVLREIADGNIADFPEKEFIFDGSSKYATSKITLACSAGKYNGVGSTGGARMRDAFPDCFFGDEIHGQWQWDTGLGDVDNAANTAVWRFYAMLQ